MFDIFARKLMINYQNSQVAISFQLTNRLIKLKLNMNYII